jgi:hypothetical protein
MASSTEFKRIVGNDRLKILRENLIPDIVHYLTVTHEAKNPYSFRKFVMRREWCPISGKVIFLDKYALEMYEDTSKQGKSIQEEAPQSTVGNVIRCTLKQSSVC